MKFYFGIIFLLFSAINVFCIKSDFRKNFLKWEKSLTDTEKVSLKDLLSEYHNAYKKKDQKRLYLLEPALENIITNWQPFYQQWFHVQTFFEDAHKYILSHSDNRLVRDYLSAYNDYDQMPTDKNRYIKLVKMQNRLQKSMK